ncbi:hypothetical protein AQS8620_01898 [Aquimixticola soesokkakensis]|uniref:Host specificity protein n=1 Tax=Aquimixticola soesokkakensis TaxID=1519096 RepID=A0A1Y5SQH1_9RHOB|nr:glycoside hydrolase/phage tail family protein [Aquimixticola soesokkakensis]SLN46076.1 hypothetical protein AQS8620_01898 [Aquimixticola soesokkakensis]
MATILLSAVGAAAGASVGGGVLGLSSVVLGRAIGATVGRVIDQRLLGSGAQAVETGKVDRLRLTGASEGTPVAQVYGRMRVNGQIIWATRFLEHVSTSGGSGKGTPRQLSVTSYSYSVSVAIALCEGEISRIGRIWADGTEISRDDLNLRVYTGSQDQLPDPKIEAVEGTGTVPAYRGMAYVVFEDLDLTPYGNRIPQFTFEVMRPSQEAVPDDLTHAVKAVALIPGTGEYSLATQAVYLKKGPGETEVANLHTVGARSDFEVSLEALDEELPNAGSVSMVVSWFGDDLRCGDCAITPKVEQTVTDGTPMPWEVSGISRGEAQTVPTDAQGRVIYGGTPADASVVQAIQALGARDKKVVFYPFILMDQLADNTLVNPWTGEVGQPALPWRGRITTSLAPGVAGTSDGTALADSEVAAFFGAAQASDFTATGSSVTYSGPAEFSFRRFILHYAHLCALAGGVDAFCIGSELRSLTQIRGASGFPVVTALKALAADVRSILGEACKIGYAADWSEYFGYQVDGNLYFHLDPLWADENIDFIGIDNYMPMSDWRDTEGEADAAYGTIYNLDYLRDNIEGGEGYDWYYAYDEHRDAQIRTPITDGAYNEPWVYRYKDIRGWWENAHFERIAGVRSGTATAWVPQSKPIWFTEIGCAAIDKATNQPNKFLDAKSSENALPHYSDGRRDEYIQMQYLRAIYGYWGDAAHNPMSEVYAGPMIDMERAHVWAWDARPYPAFPANSEVWSDAENYRKGHWINGRSTARPLSDVVREICARSGARAPEVDALHGLVRGYSVSDGGTARQALQPLQLAYGFDVIERDGALRFINRTGAQDGAVDAQTLAVSSSESSTFEMIRAPEAEVAGRVRFTFADFDNDYSARSEEAIHPDEESRLVTSTEFPLALTRAEGRAVVERWLAESRIARDMAKWAFPPSIADVGAGDVVAVAQDGVSTLYRIDHVTDAGLRQIDAVRIEAETYEPSQAAEDTIGTSAFVPPLPVFGLFLDLPLLTGQEVPFAPHVAATANIWPGTAALYSAISDAGYTLNTLITERAVIGVTQTGLGAAAGGLWDRGEALRVKLISGALTTADQASVLNGANMMAIGDGTSGHWEVFQFATATLVGARTYELSERLRGQFGTSALGAEWPAGSYVVLLNSAPKQIELASSERGLARHYRIGPSLRPFDDPSYEHLVEAFAGIGLRPYAPCHLTPVRVENGAIRFDWIRQTRIDGDSWEAFEVPLGEASERYAVDVIVNGNIQRSVIVTSPSWTYTSAQRAADGALGAFTLQVAQISDAFGAGLTTRIDIND